MSFLPSKSLGDVILSKGQTGELVKELKVLLGDNWFLKLDSNIYLV